MNRKLNNMSVILNIGSIILFLAGIGILITPEIDNSLFKFVASTIIVTITLAFSCITKELLQMNYSSKLLCYLGMFLLVITYMFGGFNHLFGSYFGLDLEGSQIFLASIYILILIISILIRCLYKNYSIIHLGFISLFAAIYHLFIYGNLNYQIAFIAIGVILFVASFAKNQNVKNFSITASYTYVLLCLILAYSNDLLLTSLLFSVNMVVIYNSLYKDKNVLCELITLGFIIASILLFGRVISIHFDLAVAYIIITFVIGLLELLVNYYKVVDGQVNKVFYKIAFFAMYAIISLLSLRTGLTTLLPITIFILLTSVGSTYLLKSSEDYLIGLKILVFILALLLNIDEYLINISDIVYVYILGISSLFMFLLGKKSYYKISSELVSFVLIIPLIVMTKEVNVIFYLASVLLIILDVLIFLSDESCIDKKFNSCLSSIYCYALFAITINANISIKYIISSLVLFLILILERKDKVKFCISLFFMVLCLRNYFEAISLNFANGEDLTIILNNILYLAFLSIIIFRCCENKNSRNILLSVVGALAVFTLLADYSSMSVILYALILSLIMLILGAIYSEYKGLYYVGIVSSISCILNLLSYIRGLPVVVYLIILGLTIIITVSIIIFRYQKRLNREEMSNINYCGACGEKIESDSKFCGSCGQKVIEDTIVINTNSEKSYKDSYCGNCGEKVVSGSRYCGNCGISLMGENNYCSNCGRKIHEDENYCENCGNKLK